MAIYRIVVDGELSDRFGVAFAGLALERGRGETALTGEIVDQAQLQGVLTHLGDFGLALRSLQRLSGDSGATAAAAGPSRGR